MDGILLFDKPLGWTSHDAVDFLRRRLGQKNIGHAGTLDPIATGLLVMLVGRATKMSSTLMGLDKEYEGAMKLGVRTDTQDLEGRVIAETPSDAVTEEQLRKTLAELTGPQQQAPPAYSAVKKNGRKLYEWAREGVAVEVASRPITVHEFNLLDFSPPLVRFSLSCSKGTYVRTLCDEVGQRLGVGAAMSELRRTRIGDFKLSTALNEAEINRLTVGEIEKRLCVFTTVSTTKA